MISTNQFKNGMTIEISGEPYAIVEFQHVKPGKGGAFVRTKLKSMKSGAVIDKTFRAGEKFEQAKVERKTVQYLYESGQNLVFMDMQSYEQTELDKSFVGEVLDYIKEGSEVTLMLINGQPSGLELPLSVELQVVETVPGVKGDTVTGGNKPAKLESGLTVSVPLFISEGDVVKVDTRNGSYVTRA